jgi:hypothetical protein
MSHCVKASSLVLALLAVILLLPGSLAAQPSGEPTTTFVYNAFVAVGINPSCSQVTLENDALVNEPSSAARLAEAQRFVSTLFEIPEAYGSPSSYVQTFTYNSRNDYSTGSNSSFVQDLYLAFTQRSADSAGLSYWTGQTNTYGRGAVLASFAGSSEFSTLVGSLGLTASYFPSSCPSSF